MDYSAVNGWAGIATSIINTRAANSVAKTQAATANYIRGLNNGVVAAENARDKELTGLARWRQDLYNKRVMENAGKDQESMAVNFNRQRDARRRASFAQQVRYAEEDGRQQAAAAASGVTGSVVDMISMTLRLKKGMQDTQEAQTDRMLEHDAEARMMHQWWANMDQLDHSLIFDNPRGLDYNRDVAQTRSPLSGIAVKDVMGAAQGKYNFSFNSPDPIGDFYQRGTSGSGD